MRSRRLPPSYPLAAPLAFERVDKQSRPYPVKSVAAETLTANQQIASTNEDHCNPKLRNRKSCLTEILYFNPEASMPSRPSSACDEGIVHRAS